MLNLFAKGGPIMWPLLLTSVISLAVVLERLLFIFREKGKRDSDLVGRILAETEQGRVDEAIAAGKNSPDFVARTLAYGLEQREKSFSNALLVRCRYSLLFMKTTSAAAIAFKSISSC